MWHKKQEIYIFNIVLFILVVFQIISVFALFFNIVEGLILIIVNILLLVLMIPYSKWAWENPSTHQVSMRVLKQEVIIIGYFVVSVGVIFFVILLIGFFKK